MIEIKEEQDAYKDSVGLYEQAGDPEIFTGRCSSGPDAEILSVIDTNCPMHVFVSAGDRRQQEPPSVETTVVSRQLT